MLNCIANLGQALSKEEQRYITGGTYYCYIYSYEDLVQCQEQGGEIVYCAPHVECAPE